MSDIYASLRISIFWKCPEAVVRLCDYPLDFAAKESVHGADEPGRVALQQRIFLT